ncbi:MAG: glucuronate isomerase [Verrucomicrobia bacterium]|nr:glucuronate isomerase [Verrucomicrobiota bacterium]MCH8510419.1 glucuronate isomerase [Kiritimatiellia bacterium]
MSQFIHDDFLLQSEPARTLYHEFAKDMPILDYHCHLSPEEIALDKRWENLTQVWLAGDHYKWRAMRTNGVPESHCTGEAGDWEKFEKFAETLAACYRNPLFHWSHLELTRYFGITELLTPANARKIYDQANEKIAGADFSARGLMRQSNVKAVCTTDDPVDDLGWHRKIREDGFEIKVLPAWRPDKAMACENPKAFLNYIHQLALITDMEIKDMDSLFSALRQRHDFFHAEGCRLSDHGIERFYAADYTANEVESALSKLLRGESLNQVETEKFKSHMLHEFGLMDHEKGWVQQYHYGALRNNNTRLFTALGPDTGFDSIGDFTVGKDISKFLDRLDQDNRLSPTILYNLNPRDNHLLASMIGNFQDGSRPGKMQHGSGWWFLDQKDGMERQIEILSQLGLLSRFVGMLTDSRSFLSYTRHEYFRRILCNMLGNDIVNGLLPNDITSIGAMVRDISFNNAANYFDFGVNPV